MQLPSADANPSSPQVSALCTHLLKLGWIDPASHIQGLSSPGAGNMNRTLRVHLQGHSTPTLILKQSVPYVAKYPDIPAPIARDQSEAAFYRNISSNPRLAERCPELLGHDHRNHLLCFQDLGAGLDFTHLYPQDPAIVPNATVGLEPAFVDLLGWLSQLHRQALPTTVVEAMPQNMAMRELNHEHIFVLPFTANNGLAEFEEVAAWQSELIDDPHTLQRIEALGALYLGAAEPVIAHCSTLLHGDFYPGSWLQASVHRTQAEAQNQPTSRAHIIDPEFGFVGPAEFDVGVFSAHLTFGGWTHTALEKLLQSYHKPDNFNPKLAAQFSAVEIMRRLLGVAKLPMQTSAATQLRWLDAAATTLRQEP